MWCHFRPVCVNRIGMLVMSKRPRKYIPLPERLASALSMLLPQEQRDDLRARKVPAKAVIRLFTPDHIILHAHGGPGKWWNITMALRGPNLKAKDNSDTSIAAKVARIRGETCTGQRKRIPARVNPWPMKGTRKIQSGGPWGQRR